MAVESVRVDVLGPVRVVRDGSEIDAGPPKQRALLAALALHRGRPVPVDLLGELLWGGRPPADAAGSLHVHVARARAALEPDRTARSPSELLLRSGDAYLLRLDDDGLDAARFESAVLRAHAALTAELGEGLPGVAAASARPRAVRLHDELTAALRQWRGTPFAELGDAEAVIAERDRLAELRLVALEDRAAAALALGRHAEVAAELAAACREHPLRERLQLLHIGALARSQRQAEALEAMQAVRRLLRDELGVDPGPALAALEAAVLRQEAAVAPSVPVPAPAAPEPAPLIGRGAELGALQGLLTSGTTFAVVLGEPGIGKSRLVRELAVRAEAAGRAVAVGRCAEDEGAPPLWPWSGVLRSLGERGLLAVDAFGAADRRLLDGLLLPSDPGAAAPGDQAPPGDGSSDRFRTYDAVARALGAAARMAPLLVVLEDLHWADASSLRLLRYLADALEDVPVAIVGTRRARPEPQGALAEAGEALARRGALRVELAGLDVAETAALVRAAGGEASPAEVAALRERAGGNPFFLQELLRLGPGEPGSVPVAVGDVVRRRVELLPAAAQVVLSGAAVIGRSFGLDLVAETTAREEDQVLEALAAAESAGLVVEEGVEVFGFAHALVRDALVDAMPATTRARQHARVAAALEPRAAADPARLSDLARHWSAAGPRYAARAWRAAEDAARYAERLHAHDEAAALLDGALGAQADDPAATDAERYRLWRARAGAAALAGDLEATTAALHEAIRIARAMGDVRALAEAAVVAAESALWLPRAYGTVDDETVAALQDLLGLLEPGDGPLRSRVLLALAAELHYVPRGRARREELAAEGLAMARRTGDRRTVARACQLAAVATWWAGNAEDRFRLLSEAIGAADAVGDDAWLAGALFQRASAAAEAGRVAEARADMTRSRALAERLRSPYHLTSLGTLESGWLALAGRFEEAEALVARTAALAEATVVPFRGETLASTWTALRLWQGRVAEVLPRIGRLAVSTSTPMGGAIVLLHLRGDDLDGAREQLARTPLLLDGEDFMAFFHAAIATEAGLLLGMPELARRGRDVLAPHAGAVAAAGSGMPLGPVDAFLALGEAALGERDRAAAHADEALRFADRWDLPPVAAWLRGMRERHRF